MKSFLAGVALAAACAAPCYAEVVSSSPTHFVLRLEAQSELAPDALWQRLITPSSWWHPDHTYSGSAANLTLDAVAGGLWKETWQDGSVAHGRVMVALSGRMLTLDAPFGPLLAAGAHTVWSITLQPADGGGTLVVFDEVANAPATAKLDELVAAVHFVKQEAIGRLVNVTGDEP